MIGIGSRSLRHLSRTLPIKIKILVPFVAIQILLGCAAITGSVLLIRPALLTTVDERLAAFEEVVVREIKKQEFALETFAGILAYQEANAHGLTPEGQILQNDLYAALGKAKISVVYYPADFSGLPFPTLRELFADAVASGKPRFRLDTSATQVPAMIVATPVVRDGKLEKILLLQTPIDRTLLKRLGAPFKIETHLLAMDGTLLTGSNPSLPPPQVSAASLDALLAGQKLYQTSTAPQHRQRLCAIPLGTSDIVLLSSELPIDFLTLLVSNLATRSGFFIGLMVILGSYVYFRLVRRILTPLKEMIQTASAVAGGDVERRLVVHDQSELGELAKTFNQMLDQLENKHVAELRADHQATVASDEERFQVQLSAKDQELDAANRELKARIHELGALFQLNQAMVATLDLQVIFERVLNTLKETVLCREMALLLYNPGNDTLEVRKTVGLDPLQMKGLSLRLGEGISGIAARSREMQYVRDVSKEGRYIDFKGRAQPHGSMVAMPLTFKGELVGVLNLHKDRPSGFSETDIKLIQAAGNQLAMAIENARLYEMTRTLANNDELTGLANRRYFHEILKRELAQASRFQSNFSMIMANIDFFKQFNETFGHLNGDVALRRVATLLLQNTRGSDLVARFGSEDFMILLPKTSKDGAVAAAEKLRQCIESEKFPVSGAADGSARLTLSLGIVEYPGDSKDIYELLDLADRALSRARSGGGNRLFVCTSDLQRHPAPPPA